MRYTRKFLFEPSWESRCHTWCTISDLYEIPPFKLDAYGGGCITKKQFEEGCKYFADAQESIANKGRDYILVLKALRGTITTLTEYMEDDREDRENGKGKDRH